MKTNLVLVAALLISSQSIATNKQHSIAIGLSSYQSKTDADEFRYEDVDDKLTKQLKYQYQLNELFSLGGQWLSTTSSEFSNSSDTRDLNWDFDSMMIFGEAKAHLIGELSGYGYIGQSYNKSRHDGYNVVEGDILLPKRVTKSAFTTSYGLGLKYQFSRIDLSLEKQWLDTKLVDLDLITFNVAFRF